ncbi:hypothetical protein H7J87_19440 [Mycolicibacterium wolinskyi]|uniref:ARB-07466-like C-terminal domain-containing protein n=1 Tax=Mycolicibacterium wolinskyi TaxID=59750 RepID=A0A1X2F962_9MYCO|nr:MULTISPECIES: hypothetical protein [Mycolicibacterium]MCV7287500.1 hypothetical protein [Mycolicibacterium wolinskyi]MCV7294398.1 hypothetical protein [Mycolicibacterium goodii]ORX14980.1 hypothetical protein AWC31_27990 [Mycolicibacterium wolinskyi]
MGRHSLASPGRRKKSAVAAAIIAPAAVLFAVGSDVQKLPAKPVAKPVAEEPPPCCMEIVSAPASSSPPPVVQPEGVNFVSAATASRWRVIDIPEALPVGDAPESGLQVKTILASRSISADFPEIQQIGGVRPDALRWHPDGLALDVMIPNPSSAAGIALGNEIVAYALKNAERFGLQDCIWRGTYYTPGGSRSGGYGHYDHVHITTTGGGYPSKGQVYLR